jgi:hypothetical protein
MANKKLSQDVVNTTIANEEKEISAISAIRQAVNKKRLANAESEFMELATKLDKTFYTESFEQAKQALKDFTIVYTRPMDEEHAKGMDVVPHDWNNVLPYGRKWFTKKQELQDSLSVARSYYSYISYMEDKDNALKREAKKAIDSMSKEELIKLLQQAKAK